LRVAETVDVVFPGELFSDGYGTAVGLSKLDGLGEFVVVGELLFIELASGVGGASVVGCDGAENLSLEDSYWVGR